MNGPNQPLDDEGLFARELEAQHERLRRTSARDRSAANDAHQDQRVKSAMQIVCLLDQQATKFASADSPESVGGVANSTQQGAETRRDCQREDDGTIDQILPNLETLGRFELKQQIGRGGFGIVIRAHDPNLNRDVAIKVPRLESALSPESRKRFERESKAAAALQHPGIVSVFETGCENDIYFIVSEFVDGDNLAACLARGDDFTPHESARLMMSLAEAVEHAHQRGVLHRDLKPSNILLRDHDVVTPLITDFGLASIASQPEFTQTGAVVGTPSYMSPEQAAGNKGLGPATDVYGLGAIFYELLTRRAPFADLPLVETLRAIVVRDPVPARSLVKDLPRDIDAICSKCLEKDPRRRYSSARELQADLQRFLDGQSVLARPVRSVGRCVRWAKRNPAISLLGFALIFGLALGLIGMTVLWQGSERNRRAAESNEQKFIDKSELMTQAVNRLFRGLANNPEVRKESADGLRKLLLQEAHGFQEEFLSDFPDDANSQLEYARSLYSLADINLFLGDARKAAELANQALIFFDQAEQSVALNPDERLNAVLLKGRAFTRCGEFSQANAAFDDSLHRLANRLGSERSALSSEKQMSRFALAFTSQAYSLHRQDRLDEAFASIEVARQLWNDLDQQAIQSTECEFSSMDQGRLQFVSAENYRLKRDYPSATKAYRAASEQFKAASQFSDQAEEANFMLAQCLRGQGITQAEQNELAAAIETYGAAIELLEPLAIAHPLVETYASLLSQIRYSLSTSLMVAGELESAGKLIATNIEEKRKLIERFPDSSATYFSYLGDSLNVQYIILYRSKMLEDEEGEQLLRDTIDAFQSAIDLNPDWPRPKMAMARAELNLGFLYARQKDYSSSGAMIDSARQQLDELIEAEPQWSEAIDAYYGATMNGVSLQVQLNNHRAAIELIEELLVRFADHPRNRETRLGMAILLAHVGQFENAQQEILDFTERSTTNPGDFIRAAEKAAQISELEHVTNKPDLVNMFNHLADELVQRGKPSQADQLVEYLEQVRSSKWLSTRVPAEDSTEDD